MEERALEAIQLGVYKSILRLNRYTTSEFVRGEVGAKELKTERNKAMLIWLGKVLGMGRDRWPRRAYDAEWGNGGGWRVKSWKKVVANLVKEYGLEEEAKELERGGIGKDWQEIVEEAVARRDLERWEEGRVMGKKLDLYREVKRDWGFEEYLEGRYGKGEIVMARLRSGSGAVGEEMARWYVKEGEEAMWKGGLCKTCENGIVESVRHVVMECEAFAVMRMGWREKVAGIIENVPGLAHADPLKLILGWRNPNIDFKQSARILCASSWLLANLWETRANMIHGPRENSRGVKGPQGHGTK